MSGQCAHLHYPEELSREIPSCTCFNVVVFPDPVTCFRLGRNAAHKAQYAAELAASGVDLLADLPANPNMPISDTKFKKFESGDKAYGKLWEALVKVDGPPMIGLYGILTRNEHGNMSDEKIFDKVTRANVGDEKIFNKVTRANVDNGNVDDVIKLQDQHSKGL